MQKLALGRLWAFVEAKSAGAGRDSASRFPWWPPGRPWVDFVAFPVYPSRTQPIFFEFFHIDIDSLQILRKPQSSNAQSRNRTHMRIVERLELPLKLSLNVLDRCVLAND
jgi:hypothetical protein